MRRVLLLIFVLAAGAFAQSAGGSASSDDWCRFESPSKEFSISFPCTGYLSDAEENNFGIQYRSTGLVLSVYLKRVDEAQEQFKLNLRSLDDKAKKEDKIFETKGIMGWQHEGTDWEKNHVGWINLASTNWTYRITSFTTNEADLRVIRFLDSIRVNDTRLFKPVQTFPAESRTISIAGSKRDPLIQAALAVPDSRQKRLEKWEEADGNVNEDRRTCSKEAMFLRKPRPSYTDQARQKNIAGNVILRVLLLADGSVGSIKLVKSLGGGLDDEAFKVAKKIKFLPAEIDGKTVDRWKEVEYTFSIY